MTTGSDLLGRYAGAMVQVFGTPQLVLASGEGCWVSDVDGKRYLDLLVGHRRQRARPRPPGARAGGRPSRRESAIHVSNFFTSEPAIALAERLLSICRGPDRVGGLLRQLRRRGHRGRDQAARGAPAARGSSPLEGAFHGRTTGALALTHKAAYREPFEPLIPRGRARPARRRRRARAPRSTTTTAALVRRADPGRGRRPRPLADDYLRPRPRADRRAHGALLVLDEIQTGIGRTGRLVRPPAPAGIVPDAMTLAKGLGGGVPIGALVDLRPDVTALLGAGQHGTTFGGNPLACAAGLAVLDTIERDGLLATRRARSAPLLDGARPVGRGVAGTRGRGLLRAIELDGIPSAAARPPRARRASSSTP